MIEYSNEILYHECYSKYLLLSHFMLHLVHLVATVDAPYHYFVFWETLNVGWLE